LNYILLYSKFKWKYMADELKSEMKELAVSMLCGNK